MADTKHISSAGQSEAESTPQRSEKKEAELAGTQENFRILPVFRVKNSERKKKAKKAVVGPAKQEPIQMSFPVKSKTFRMKSFGQDLNPTGPEEEAELDRKILTAQNQELTDQSIGTLRKVSDMITDKASFKRMKTMLQRPSHEKS